MHQGISYFDVRVHVPIKGDIHNLHIVVVPHFDRHTAVNMTALIVKICGNLFSRWRSKLIGTMMDGENNMTGRQDGVVTWIQREGEHAILCVWCAPHQIDLCVKTFINALNEGVFYKMTHSLCSSTQADQSDNLNAKHLLQGYHALGSFLKNDGLVVEQTPSTARTH